MTIMVSSFAGVMLGKYAKEYMMKMALFAQHL
jgi:hypothetical protein